MTNYEKYKDEIANVHKQGHLFALTDEGIVPCISTECDKCKFGSLCDDKKLIWLLSKYEKPTIDWTKVPVDAKILVRDFESDIWEKRYFAKYKNGKVYAWENGCASYTTESTIPWNYAKLYEEGKEND